LIIPSFLVDHSLRLIFFGGKGGVGKTTCATASAIEVARRRSHESFLLVSTDPAHSVADSLAEFNPPSNLTIIEMDAAQSLARFKQEHMGEIREIVARGTFLDDEDINQLIDLSLPGLDELMALLEINAWIAQKQYHCILVDSAPTGHTLRLLEAPQFIRRWLRVLNVLSAKHRYMKKVFGKGTHPDRAESFLGDLLVSLQHLDRLLKDSSCCRFVPIAIAEKLSVLETVSLIKQLREKTIPVAEVIINRIIPYDDCACCAERRAKQFRELRVLLKNERLSQYSFWGIPLFPLEMRGEHLCVFWHSVYKLPGHYRRPRKRLPDLECRVDGAATFAIDDMRLIFLAGKGGVGKTTLACATALGAARRYVDKRILLLSVDPAHSLSDCLKVSVSEAPHKLLPNLTVRAINAPAEFEALKGRYQQEIKKFLTSITSSFDLTFDREVLERIMDLAPPGIDEIMAVTQISRLLRKNEYDMVILDSAPTGHLIRLLELPEIIDQWLKVFFRVILKYKNIFQFGNVSQKLVQLSKDIKEFRRLLNDREKCTVFAVSILTEMAFLETTDLLRTCKNIGISVTKLFLNMATRKQNCFLCSALEKQEQQIRQKYGTAFPDIEQAVVYTQNEPIGLALLSKLAEVLYKDAGQVASRSGRIGAPRV